MKRRKRHTRNEEAEANTSQPDGLPTDTGGRATVSGGVPCSHRGISAAGVGAPKRTTKDNGRFSQSEDANTGMTHGREVGLTLDIAGLMPHPLQRKRCVLFARVANSQDGDRQLKKQVVLLRNFALEKGFFCVAEICAIGMAHIPTKMVDQLIHRKSERNDFDTVLVYELSRISRSGPTCAEIMRRLQEVGVEICSATDMELNAPPFAALIKGNKGGVR